MGASKLAIVVCGVLVACAHKHPQLETQQTALQEKADRLETRVSDLERRTAALERQLEDLLAVPEPWLAQFEGKRWCTILHADSQRSLAKCNYDTEAVCRQAVQDTSPNSDVLGVSCVPRPAWVWCIRQAACFVEEASCRTTADYWTDAEPSECTRRKFPPPG